MKRWLWIIYAGGWAAAACWATWTFPAAALRDTTWILLGELVLVRATVNLADGYLLPAAYPIQLASLLLLPPQAVVLAESLNGLLCMLTTRVKPELGLFNTANNAVPALVAVSLFRWLAPTVGRGPFLIPGLLLAALVAIGFRLIVTAGGIYVRLALISHQPASHNPPNLSALTWPALFLVPLALLMAWAYPTAGPWTLGILVLLLHSLNRIIQFYSEREVLVRTASLDGLTGVRNRRAWEEEAERNRGLLPEHSLLVMVDLDGLKNLNDTFGHLEGDSAIRELADCLRQSAGGTEYVYRFGGDEFVVYRRGEIDLPQIMERITEASEEYSHTWALRGVQIAASVGMATSPEDGTTLRELFQAADQAMYQVKRRRAGVQVEQLVLKL
ncbi:MAG: GGDEF domain-containing protein [Mycobacterium leprae]